jgi:hypothetical protein
MSRTADELNGNVWRSQSASTAACTALRQPHMASRPEAQRQLGQSAQASQFTDAAHTGLLRRRRHATAGGVTKHTHAPARRASRACTCARAGSAAPGVLSPPSSRPAPQPLVAAAIPSRRHLPEMVDIEAPWGSMQLAGSRSHRRHGASITLQSGTAQQSPPFLSPPPAPSIPPRRGATRPANGDAARAAAAQCEAWVGCVAATLSSSGPTAALEARPRRA